MTGLEACPGAAQHTLCFPPATPYARNNSYNEVRWWWWGGVIVPQLIVEYAAGLHRGLFLSIQSSVALQQQLL